MKDVLQILERDARTPVDKIAVMTGRSPQEVEAIIARAEQERTILKYKTVVNWERAGEDLVTALIEVRVTPQRGTGFDAIAERIYRYPEARTVYLMSGTYDLAVIVVGRSMREVSTFVAEKLASLDQVQGTVTHFLLKRYKEDGDILDGPEPVQRLAVTP